MLVAENLSTIGDHWLSLSLC